MASTYIELAPSAQATIVGEVEVANDSGNPVPVSAIDLDIRNLDFATDSIDVSGSNINISAADLDIRDLTFATDSVDVSGSEVALDAATLAALETITVDTITNPVTVQATNLDIRDLNSSTDSVTIVNSNLDAALSTLATSANQTNRSQKTQLTNGTIDVTVKQVSNQIVSTDNALITNTVIHGLSTAGGGSYVDVKVNPSGSLEIGTVAAVTNITNPVTVQSTNLDIRDLTSVTDSVSAVQSGTWNITNVSGTVSLPTGASTAANQATIIGHVDGIESLLSGTLTVQSTNLDIRDLAFATDKVDVSGSILGANSGVDIGDVTINNAAGASAVNIQDGGNSITVDGTIAATQSGTWILGANSGVDIGDVTINNAAGASAVNIQDGGNSITVDGTVAFSNTTIAVTNAGTFATQAAQSGTWNITNISGTVSLPTGAATESTLSTLNGKVPANLTVTSTRLLVDGSGVTQPVSGTVTAVNQTTTTGTPAAVTVSTAAVLLKASNSSRRSIIITNNGTGDLFIGHTSGVTSSGAAMGLIVPAKSSYSDSGPGLYTGDLYGIYSAAAASQNVSVSERT